mgnify:CR=1 FL=1
MPHTVSTPRLAYETHGTGGDPVLMIMGFGMRGLVWRPQVATLREHHRVITYDHRGVGASDAPGDWPSMHTLRDDALRLADELELDRFHVIGTSMGGMVAQHVALHAPDRVRSLSLVVSQGGGPLAWVPPVRGIARFLRVGRARNPHDRARAMERLLFTEGFRDRVAPEALEQRHRDTSSPAPPATLARQFWAIARHRALDDLAALSVPTLVVGADRDHLIRPSHSERLAATIPHARFVRIQQAGHGIIFEQADALNEELLRHLRAHGAQASA